jgi:hypothetical protein
MTVSAGLSLTSDAAPCRQVKPRCFTWIPFSRKLTRGRTEMRVGLVSAAGSAVSVAGVNRRNRRHEQRQGY